MAEGIQYDDQWSQRLLAMYQTPDVAGQRQVALGILQPKPGEHILDIGSGPGLMALQLAQIVGADGSVTGTDVSREMNGLARRICANFDNVRFEEENATSLAAADATFDAAISMQVFEYIDDVEAALAELHRVLKPGGRALILDTDWDTLVWNTSNRRRMRRVLAAFEGHCSHPRLPRTLAAQLRGAGFEVTGQSVYVVHNTRYDRNSYSYGLIDFIESYVKNGANVEPREVEEWAAELRSLGRQDQYFFSSNRYLILASKAAAPSRH